MVCGDKFNINVNDLEFHVILKLYEWLGETMEITKGSPYPLQLQPNIKIFHFKLNYENTPQEYINFYIEWEFKNNHK